MTTLVYTSGLPTPGSTSNAVADPELVSAFNNILAWGNGNIDGTNVAATLTGRRLVAQAAVVVGPSVTIGNYFILADGTLLASGSTTTKAIMWSYLDPANFAVTGKTNTQAIVRLSAGTSGPPGITFNGQLNAVSFNSSGVNLSPTMGALQGSAASVAPGGGSAAVAESGGGVFTFPTAGAYTPIINLSGTSSSSSATTLLWQLFALNS